MRAVAAAAAVGASAAANICGTNATLGAAVVASLNLTYPGLEAVARAAGAGDLGAACDALAAYYAAANTSWWLRGPPVPPGTGLVGGAVDAMVFNDTFAILGTVARVPRNADGGLDWLFTGPRQDPEFMNVLNRFENAEALQGAWRATGNPVYPASAAALVKDWVTHAPCPNALGPGAPCVPLGVAPGAPCSWAPGAPAQACATGMQESPWRLLEVGIRAGGAWNALFFGLQNAPSFDTDARVLMVLAAAEHAAALVVDGGDPGGGVANWEITQFTGLLTATLTFPELVNATLNRAIALRYLQQLVDSGVYPDGVETEQAAGYDMNTARAFYQALTVLATAGVSNASLPPAFHAAVERMWSYGAFVADASGCIPHNGDSDVCGAGFDAGVTAYFGRDDWTYVHSNGAAGSVPPLNATRGPSSNWSWAGQIVMRSGYDAEASWLWFDVGPYGTSVHAHRDKLQVMLHARGAILLADSGRFAYKGNDLSATLHTEFARNTTAHNSITLDGCDQLPLPAKAGAPIADASFAFAPAADRAFGAMSEYDGLAGAATHTRAVHYARAVPGAPRGPTRADGDWAVVVDVIASDRPRDVQLTWHAHPNANVTLDGGTHGARIVGAVAATGAPSRAQLCVVPAPAGGAGAGWAAAALVRGQRADPAKGVRWMGWFSAGFDDAFAAPALVYSAPAAPPGAVFAWLLVPAGAAAPCDGASIAVLAANASAVTVRATVWGDAHEVVLPIA